jgi:hypothetical protein
LTGHDRKVPRVSIVETDQSEWIVWILNVLTQSNGWFREIRCIAKSPPLRMRTFSASAIAASAKGGFVRRAPVPPTADFALAAKVRSEELHRCDIGYLLKFNWQRSALSLVLSRFSSGLFRAMFAMKEIENGKEIHRRV